MIDRIRTRDSFVRLRREGRRIRVDPLWCTYLRDPSLETPHVAFALGRAIGTAVTRNRLRRRLRSILDTHELSAGLFLIGGSARATELTFEQLSTTVTKLVRATESTT